MENKQPDVRPFYRIDYDSEKTHTTAHVYGVVQVSLMQTLTELVGCGIKQVVVTYLTPEMFNEDKRNPLSVYIPEDVTQK